MSNKGLAIVLATAIYAGNKNTIKIQGDTEERLYAAINGHQVFNTDEAKADVYAQLAETLTEHTPFELATDLIEVALNNTEKALYGQH